MKNLIRFLPIGIAAVLFIGCVSQSSIKVATDERTDVDISKYRTFNWVSDVGEIPSDQIFIGPRGVLIFNNRSARRTIQESIQTQLEARGFTRDRNNPDMLANFTVMEQDGQLRTYRGENNSYLGAGPVQQGVDMVEVEAGTVIINFVDADSGVQVWQGFASGALEESDVKDERTLQTKVSAIFKEFDFSTFSLN